MKKIIKKIFIFVFIYVLAYSIHLFAQSQTDKTQVKNLETSSPPAPAFSWKERYKERLRPYVLKFFGKDIEAKYLGPSPTEKLESSILLPSIPTIEKETTSVKIYEEYLDTVQWTIEEEQRYYKTFVRELLTAIRRSEPTVEDLEKYTTLLFQGARREGVYRLISLDDIAQTMESNDKVATQPLVEFVLFFHKKYLNISLKQEQLRGMNAYQLRRLTVDKTLDLIEVLKINRKDLEDWYSVLSSDFSVMEPTLFKNILRKNKEKSYHRRWAKSVPVQHIQSEVVIKLLLIMNVKIPQT